MLLFVVTGAWNSHEQEIVMNGTFTTVDGSVINNDCANDYSVNLRNSMDVMQVIINQLLVSGDLCGNMPEVDIELWTRL